MIPWLTIWGYGTDIRATENAFFVRAKGKSKQTRYQADSLSHIIIAGDNVLNTSVVLQCSKKNIPISFFDIHGNFVGHLFRDEKPHLSSSQDLIPAYAYALSAIETATTARMGFLHELSVTHESLFYQGELDILTHSRDEFEYLITLPELTRAYLLSKSMYYEILSRVVSKSLRFSRRVERASPDPVNLLFSKGYAILHATTSVACVGAGLDLNKSSLFEKKGACAYEIMEPALVSMVDRAVIEVATSGVLDDFVMSASRCIISEEASDAFNKKLAKTINRKAIDENVYAYAKCVEEGTVISYHYPL